MSQNDPFAAPTAAPAPAPAPDACHAWNSREPDDFDLIAHERYEVPAHYRWLEVETLGGPHTPRRLASFRLLMVHAYPGIPIVKRGERKGRINWRKRDKSKDREVVVSFAQFDEFRAKRAALAEATP